MIGCVYRFPNNRFFVVWKMVAADNFLTATAHIAALTVDG